MRLIGLCGRSGSGKSSFSQIAETFGIKTIDCDRVYKEMVSRPSECLEELRLAFGDGIISNGALNRRVLAPIVFSDKSKLELLNRITHKHITAKVKSILSQLEKDDIVLLDAPTLFESGLNKECDSIIAVVCSDEVSIGRIMSRDNISREDAISRLSNQKPLDFYYKHCNIIIENNETVNEFKKKAEELLKSLKEGSL